MKEIKIGNLTMRIPIIQGGMGVGVSLGNLAGHVALEGGMGVISTAHPGYRKKNFARNALQANKEALKEEIEKAKKIACGKGIVAINAMVAITDYAALVEHAVASGVDAIISGAGLPLQLPKFVKNNVKIAPIVSSGKAIHLILQTWHRKYKKTADFIVIEGSEAGGHLGFKKADILSQATQKLPEILSDVLERIKPFEKEYNQRIPVFVAGGIFTGGDIRKYLQLGASGVQMATRFIATHECDANIKFKEALLKSKENDIQLVGSPVGLPGRAVMTPLTRTLEKGERVPVKKCYDCLIPCNPSTTQYCISGALIEAVKGNLTEGLVFSGSNGYRLDRLRSVKELIHELMEECALEECKV